MPHGYIITLDAGTFLSYVDRLVLTWPPNPFSNSREKQISGEMAGINQCAAKLEYQPEARYPDNPFFKGPEAPCRFEAEIYNCMVRGEIPPQIDGTYYRVMPDALWAPLYDDDVFINGDGAVDAVRIKDGHADFKQKFVRTEKFTIERAARRAVYGKYRNRYTDDPRVRTRCHATANTHVVYFENQLLALKEDSLPYAMNPDTLETKGKSTADLESGRGIAVLTLSRRLRFPRTIHIPYFHSSSQGRSAHW
jgi:hypothetical protein